MPILNWLGRDDALKTATNTPYRLLEEVPELGYGDKTKENMIVQGDNLEALKALLPFYAGQVKCIYIDPPYNTGSAFEHYDDNLEHSTWLSMMSPRLELLKEFLREDGYIFIQIDDVEQAYLKVLCDEIFGRKNHVNTICVNMNSLSGVKMTHVINGKRFPAQKEYVLLYKKSDSSCSLIVEKNHKEKWDKEYNLIIPEMQPTDFEDFQNIEDEEINRRLSSMSLISLAQYATDNNITLSDDWKWNNSYRIFGSKSNRPLAKREKENTYSQVLYCYTNEDGNKRFFRTDFNRDVKDPRIELVQAEANASVFVSDNWTDISTDGGIAQEGGVVFPKGKKPERLIERIVRCSTHENDIILDSFLGSGTTAAVAHKMGRRYIGIEMGNHAITHCVPRLKAVVDGEQGGISKAVNWQGGGGFRFYKLGEQVFDADGCINENISFENLSAHIWFTETKTPFNKPVQKSTYLGTCDNVSYALLYNGILRDKRVDGGNVLTNKTLNVILDDMKHQPYEKLVIYGESSRISPARLKTLHIEFKQTPYDIKAR